MYPTYPRAVGGLVQGKEPLGSARTSRGAGRARKAWPPTWPLSPPARDAPGARRADRRGLRPRPPPDPRHLRGDDDPAARGLGRPGSGGRGCRSDCRDRSHELRRARGAGTSGRRRCRPRGRRRTHRAGRLLDRDWSGVAFGADAILLAIAALTILRRVILGASEVDFRTILGAISVFTLLGLLFAFLFVGFANASHTEFFTGVPGPRSSDYLFFSYTTLTTTGYGNLVPAGTVGQSFAVLEMLVGQVFLVTLVAGLVSLWRPGRTAKAPVDGDR